MCLCCTRFDGVDVFILILTFMATVLILPVGLRSLDDCIVKYFMQPILISGLSCIKLSFFIKTESLEFTLFTISPVLGSN